MRRDKQRNRKSRRTRTKKTMRTTTCDFIVIVSFLFIDPKTHGYRSINLYEWVCISFERACELYVAATLLA